MSYCFGEKLHQLDKIIISLLVSVIEIDMNFQKRDFIGAVRPTTCVLKLSLLLMNNIRLNMMH